MIDFNEFNKECLKIYGEKYEYIPFEGKKKYNEVITFKCPKHGIVHERIRTFLKGKGCRYCLNLKNDEKIAIDKDIFLKKSDELYGDKFTINIETYKNRTNKQRNNRPREKPKSPKSRNRSKRNSEKRSRSAKSNGRIKPSTGIVTGKQIGRAHV